MSKDEYGNLLIEISNEVGLPLPSLKTIDRQWDKEEPEIKEMDIKEGKHILKFKINHTLDMRSRGGF